MSFAAMKEAILKLDRELGEQAGIIDAQQQELENVTADRDRLLAICRESLVLWEENVGADEDVPDIVRSLREVCNADR